MIDKGRLIIAIGLGFVAFVSAGPVRAGLNIFACEPEWAALAGEIGGDKVSVFTATTAKQDPHQVQARPALIAQLRSADLARQRRPFGFACEDVEFGVGLLGCDECDDAQAKHSNKLLSGDHRASPNNCGRHARRG